MQLFSAPVALRAAVSLATRRSQLGGVHHHEGHSPEECQVLGDTWGLIVQGLLFGVCLSILLTKWYLEVPRRKFLIFILDSSKQIVGAGVIHVLNMVCAMLFSGLESATADECAWYWVNIMIDTTFGVVVCWALLKVSEKVFGYDSGHYGKGAKTGIDWDSDPDYGKWAQQISVWCVIVGLMKLIVVIIMYIWMDFWEWAAIKATHWIEDKETRLIFVMIFTPTCMNIFQFCVTDTFLKWKGKGDNTQESDAGSDTIKPPPGPHVEISEPEKKTVLVVGEAGAGKTCLVRLLEGVNKVDKPAADLTTDDFVSLQQLGAGEGSTKSVQKVDVSVGDRLMCLIDTPGFADNSGTTADGREDLAHSQLVAEALRGAELLHCVLLVINGTQARMNPSVGHTLKIIQKHMPQEFLEKTIVVFTYVESENRCPFPVQQLAGVVFDGEPPKGRLVHLENPLGQLTGMSESALRERLDGDDLEARDDLRREVKKGAKVANDLATKIQGFSATRCPASSATSGGGCCCQ